MGIAIGAAALGGFFAAPALAVGAIGFGLTVGAGVAIDLGASKLKDYIYKR
ncbi:MAG: hypothetical protein RR636_06715 [Clostridium sp.]|uniref:hypothetical protein n=1 Tax=Clostridium sp. TaxID=1506 RepID=UPI0030447159